MEGPRHAATGSFRLGYQPGLDGVRGLSVILIMVFHSFVMWDWMYGRVVPGAYITVNMFFVLSGFLITSLLLGEHHRNQRVSFRSFYLRRALRLVPALMFLLAAHSIYTAIRHSDSLGDEFGAIGWIAVYAGNWSQWADRWHNLYVSLSLGHTWTLAVEEQFYFVWPLLLVFLLRAKLRARTLGIVLAVGVAVVTIDRMIVEGHAHIRAGLSSRAVAQILERTISIRTDVRADALLLGALAAVALHAGWRPARSFRVVGSLSLAALIAVSLFVQPDARWMFSWGFTVVDAAGAVICVAALDPGWGASRVLGHRVSAWLGRLSYALYLWHPPVFLIFTTDVPGPLALRFTLAWITTFALAALSYYVVELPFLRLKDRVSRRAPARVG